MIKKDGMKNLKNVKLVIFDLDGTLVNSSKDITNALNYAIKPHGFNPLTEKETIKMVGDGLTRLVEKFLGPDNQHIKESVLNSFISYYTEHLTDFTKPYPMVKETLAKLDKYKKAVISNKREFLSKKLLHNLDLLRFFDAVLGSDSALEKKPSPEPIKKALNNLNVRPEDAVIVGDSDNDILAGKNAGIKTIGVTYGYRSAEMLKDADFLINKIDELLPLLTDWE